MNGKSDGLIPTVPILFVLLSIIVTSITQHVRSVLNNEDARRMLSDCGYIKLLNQAPDDANDIARLLHISDEEKRYIENAEVGSGLLIADKVVVPFNNTSRRTLSCSV